MLIRNATLPGRDDAVDVRCEGGLVSAVEAAGRGTGLRDHDVACIDALGGALLPGLYDHHLHLCALAAQCNSLQCGPDAVSGPAALAARLQGAGGDGWIRAVGYHESVAGPLDRRALDRMVADRPLRMQHRSGKLWVLNSLAARRLQLDKHTDLPGVECDSGGRPTGRLFRLDSWLREQLAREGGTTSCATGSRPAPPSLAAVSRQLAAWGVTGVTDTSPDNGPAAMTLFENAVRRGELLQRIRVMGAADLPPATTPGVSRGERKILLDEDRLPALEELARAVGEAHAAGRGVAFHCVTPTELVLALGALREAGGGRGDRIEHASLVPDDLLPLLRASGATVVTQPQFIAARGDQYLQDVAVELQSSLYRLRGLLDAGIPLAGSSDAPYGSHDPWRAMRAAVERRTAGGAVIGAAEALTPEQALALFTGEAAEPGRRRRRVAAGAMADLCLLDRPWQEARLRLDSADVLATVVAGELVYCRAALQASGGRRAPAA